MAEQPAVPALLERSQVPAHFPVFRTVATLAHLAHCGKGPPYVIVGGRAWYDATDIRTWLDQNKRRGPPARAKADPSPLPRTTPRRGRPSKLEQYRRRVRAGLQEAASD